MSGAPLEIFNPASGSDESLSFKIVNQVTITAIGLLEDDYITFEAIQTSPAERDKLCGCYIIPGTPGQVMGIIELQCPTCESDTPQVVRLTTRNPVVILDAPQTGLLRAIYHGDGVAMHLVTAWVQETDTQDLTDSMRGCPPVCCEDEPQTWDDTGERRCFEGNYEMREISNCGNYRWTVIEAFVWVDTGQTRCDVGGVERQQQNQCGEIRWDVTEASVWVDTGNTRCVDGQPEKQQINQCGFLQWIDDGSAVWVPTGATRCNGGNVEAQEESACGFRWVVTGAVTWTDTGVRRCTAGAPERQEINDCGQLRWVSDGAIAWTPTGATRCESGNVEQFEENQCGDTRWSIVGPVTWTADGTTRCLGGNYQAREVDNCGNFRWTTIEAIAWTPTGLSECIGGVITIQEENQCGNLRWTPTEESCVAPPVTIPLGAMPPTPTDDCEIPATLYGVPDALLGAPEGWLDISSSIVPYYGIVPCCEINTDIRPAAAPATTKDCILPMLTYGGEEALLGRPLGFINYFGYLLPYYGVAVCGTLASPAAADTACVIPVGMIGRRDAIMGQPQGWVDIGGYAVPFYAVQGCG